MNASCGYSFFTSTRPVRISSHRGLRKKSSSTRNSDVIPWLRHASRTQLTTASGSRDRIVRPITFLTLQYEHVNGHPRDVSIVDHRQMCVGDDGHDDIVLAGFGADSLGHRVSEFEFAAQEILDNLAPKIFRLAHDGRDTAAVDECSRFGVA